MKRIPMNGHLLDRTRGEPVYQAVIIDLAKAGIIDKDKAENLLGYKIKDSWANSRYSKEVNKTETVTEEVAEETVTEEVAEETVTEETVTEETVTEEVAQE